MGRGRWWQNAGRLQAKGPSTTEAAASFPADTKVMPSGLFWSISCSSEGEESLGMAASVWKRRCCLVSPSKERGGWGFFLLFFALLSHMEKLSRPERQVDLRLKWGNMTMSGMSSVLVNQSAGREWPETLLFSYSRPFGLCIPSAQEASRHQEVPWQGNTL